MTCSFAASSSRSCWILARAWSSVTISSWTWPCASTTYRRFGHWWPHLKEAQSSRCHLDPKAAVRTQRASVGRNTQPAAPTTRHDARSLSLTLKARDGGIKPVGRSRQAPPAHPARQSCHSCTRLSGAATLPRRTAGSRAHAGSATCRRLSSRSAVFTNTLLRRLVIGMRVARLALSARRTPVRNITRGHCARMADLSVTQQRLDLSFLPQGACKRDRAAPGPWKAEPRIEHHAPERVTRFVDAQPFTEPRSEVANELANTRTAVPVSMNTRSPCRRCGNGARGPLNRCRH